jgi:hypothetical protein
MSWMPARRRASERDYEDAGTLVSFRYPFLLALGAGGAQEGTWHALLTVKRPELRRYLAKLAKE